jgi:hypothetical protein
VYFLTLLLVLAQGDHCTDRRPGLSTCITYERVGGKVSCRAACYVVTEKDGGTTGYTVKSSGHPSEASCESELRRQATNGCHP